MNLNERNTIFSMQLTAHYSTYIYGAVTAVVLGFFLSLFKRRSNEPPGPWRLPLIGNLFLLGALPHISLTKLAAKYGKVFKMRLGSRKVVIINDASTAKEALVDNSKCFSGRPPFNSFQLSSFEGRNVAFTQSGPQYQFNKMVAHTSLVKFLTKPETLSSHILKNVLDLVETLKSRNARSFNPITELKDSIADLMCSLTFGSHIPSTVKMQLARIVSGSTEFVESCCIANLVDFIPWLKLVARKQIEKIENSTRYLVDFITSLLQLHTYKSSPEPRCIADALISVARTHTTKDEDGKMRAKRDGILFDEKSVALLLTDYIGAAYEKLSTTLSWAIAYLAAHEEIQRELQEELDNALGNKLPDFSDRDKLPLLQATIREIFRHSSILPLALPHYTNSEAIVAGYTIPQDTTVFVNLSAINHDPKYFQDPQRFNPHRFLDERGQLVGKSSIPFSIGERKCLGSTLADLQMFMLIGVLVKKLRFEWDDDFKSREQLDGTFGLTVRPKPYKVRVYMR